MKITLIKLENLTKNFYRVETIVKQLLLIYLKEKKLKVTYTQDQFGAYILLIRIFFQV